MPNPSGMPHNETVGKVARVVVAILLGVALVFISAPSAAQAEEDCTLDVLGLLCVDVPILNPPATTEPTTPPVDGGTDEPVVVVPVPSTAPQPEQPATAPQTAPQVQPAPAWTPPARTPQQASQSSGSAPLTPVQVDTPVVPQEASPGDSIKTEYDGTLTIPERQDTVQTVFGKWPSWVAYALIGAATIALIFAIMAVFLLNRREA